MNDVDEVPDENDEISNVSTVNSAKLKPPTKSMEDVTDLVNQINHLKVENTKLLSEMLDTQKKSYQNMMKLQANDQNLLAESLKNFHSQMSHLSRIYDRTTSHGYFSDAEHRKSGSPSFEITSAPPSLMTHDETDSQGKSGPPSYSNFSRKALAGREMKGKGVRIDVRLSEWLTKNVDEETRKIILSTEFSYDDFLYETEKEDIRRIGLK